MGGALSDIEGLEDSDLVVNWRGKRSRGWGGWSEKGGEVEETFRFVCPNNPAVRGRRCRLRRLACYDFAGVFLDKIRFPSAANGVDEMLSCFCSHCRDEAERRSRSDAVVKALADRAIDPAVRLSNKRRRPSPGWLGCSPAAPSFLASSASRR